MNRVAPVLQLIHSASVQAHGVDHEQDAELEAGTKALAAYGVLDLVVGGEQLLETSRRRTESLAASGPIYLKIVTPGFAPLV